MREELLGYLLGALEPEEMQRVSDALRTDAKLRAELNRLAASLSPLDEDDEIYEPPADLIGRTMAALPPREPSTDQWSDEDSVDEAWQDASDEAFTFEGAFSDPAAGDSTADHDSTAGSVDPVPAANEPRRGRGLRRVRGRELASSGDTRGGGWSWVDVLATAAAALLLAGLVLPGILRQRATARQEACQDQLRTAGIALTQYASDRPDGRLPQLGWQGHDAFAGFYAVELKAAGRLDNRTPLWCPSLDVPEGWTGQAIPTRDQLRLANPTQLVTYQRAAGGHYAYSLGILEGERYRAPRFQARPYFAILADAPMQSLDGWVMAHEGRGCNILFEDGHITFMSNWDSGVLGDHPFLNRSGELAHGLDPDDAALAPSHFPPQQLRRVSGTVFPR